MWKKHKLVMLPTEKATKLYITGTLGELICDSKEKVRVAHGQHLLILSDEEIKEGDWVYSNKGTLNIQQVSQKTFHDKRNYGWKKIIATTDKSLGLPEPPQSFITKYVEEYNKGNVITDVMVEYDDFTSNNGVNLNDGYHVSLVINKDNTINIKSIKNSWNIEEIEDIHVAVMKQGCLYEGGKWSDEHERLVRLEFNKWKKENI